MKSLTPIMMEKVSERGGEGGEGRERVSEGGGMEEWERIRSVNNCTFFSFHFSKSRRVPSNYDW